MRWERTSVTSTTAHVRIQTVDSRAHARQDTSTMASTVQVLSLLYTLCYMPCCIFGQLHSVINQYISISGRSVHNNTLAM